MPRLRLYLRGGQMIEVAGLPDIIETVHKIWPESFNEKTLPPCILQTKNWGVRLDEVVAWEILPDPERNLDDRQFSWKAYLDNTDAREMDRCWQVYCNRIKTDKAFETAFRSEVGNNLFVDAPLPRAWSEVSRLFFNPGDGPALHKKYLAKRFIQAVQNAEANTSRE